MANIPEHTERNEIILIKCVETLKLRKYRNTVGLWTISYGHLILPTETFYRSLAEEEENLYCMKTFYKQKEALSGWLLCRSHKISLMRWFNVGIS